MNGNQAVAKVAQLARDMPVGYAAHDAAINIVPQLLRDGNTFIRLIRKYPSVAVERKGGPKWSYDTQDALGSAQLDKAIVKELPLVWLTGALLAVGDALERNGYFDRAPELELIRHLRNGIAHGNRFDIRDPEKLKKYPAHNRNCYKHSIFEITPARDGQPVLFDFMKAGDVLDLLFAVADHLDEVERRASPQPVVVTEAERLRLIERSVKSQK